MQWNKLVRATSLNLFCIGQINFTCYSEASSLTQNLNPPNNNAFVSRTYQHVCIFTTWNHMKHSHFYTYVLGIYLVIEKKIKKIICCLGIYL